MPGTAYRWSSPAAHLAGKDDVVAKVAPMLDRVSDSRWFLAVGVGDDYAQLFERHESTRRPLGPKRFIVMLKKARALQSGRRGRKPRRNR